MIRRQRGRPRRRPPAGRASRIEEDRAGLPAREPVATTDGPRLASLVDHDAERCADVGDRGGGRLERESRRSLACFRDRDRRLAAVEHHIGPRLQLEHRRALENDRRPIVAGDLDAAALKRNLRRWQQAVLEPPRPCIGRPNRRLDRRDLSNIACDPRRPHRSGEF